MRSAITYARVSSKEQEREGFSIPAQINLFNWYAAQKEFVIERGFTDVETAKQAGRSGFKEMVAFLRNNRTHVLLVEKTDRLYRNIKDWVTMDDVGAEIHFVREGEILAPKSGSSEKFMHGIKVLMAKNYIDNLAEETRKGMLEKARQGIWPSYAPLGYRNVPGTDGKRTIEPDPTLAPVITRMFGLYATGRYAVRQMAQTARELGLVYRKSGDAVPSSTVRKILRNRIYMGDFEFDGTTYRGSHQPLVSRELWDRVQAILDGRGSKKTHRIKERFAFSDLMTCGHCGCAMVGEIKKGRYIYYHCTGHKGKCPEPYTREEVLETKFAQLLKGIRFSPEVLAWVTTALRQSHIDEKQFHDQALMNLHRENKRIQDRIDSMYLDKLDGRIDADFFDRNAQQWRAKQQRIMAEINGHRAAKQSYIEEGIKLLELAQRAGQLFEKQSAPEKRRLLDFVVSNSTWKDGVLAAEYRQPFALLADAVSLERTTQLAGAASPVENENWLLR